MHHPRATNDIIILLLLICLYDGFQAIYGKFTFYLVQAEIFPGNHPNKNSHFDFWEFLGNDTVPNQMSEKFGERAWFCFFGEKSDQDKHHFQNIFYKMSSIKSAARQEKRFTAKVPINVMFHFGFF